MSTNQDIYTAYATKIHRFFSNKAAVANDIEDLIQTTFVRFFETPTTMKIREPERYLYRIARLVLFEYWRKRSRAKLHDDIGELSLADLGAGISTLISTTETQQRVLDALRGLRLDYQTVIELKYWERLSYKEIAELLEINPATVGVWLRRGRQQLRRRLGPDSSPPEDDGPDPDPDPDDSFDPDRDSNGLLTSLMEVARSVASEDDLEDE